MQLIITIAHNGAFGW